MATGEVSEKLGRGRHTTRHVELYPVGGGFLADTPGFSSVELEKFAVVRGRRSCRTASGSFPYVDQCRFGDCSHAGKRAVPSWRLWSAATLLAVGLKATALSMRMPKNSTTGNFPVIVRKGEKMPRCVIFTAGDQHGIEKHEIGLRHDDFVICCDAGYQLAQRLSVRPDLLLGDFDSYTGALPEDIPVRRYIRNRTTPIRSLQSAMPWSRGTTAFCWWLPPAGGWTICWATCRSWPLSRNMHRVQQPRSWARTSGSGCWMEAASPFRASQKHLLGAVPQRPG